jgi:hypothetical protein
VVEYLPIKHEALRSNSSTARKMYRQHIITIISTFIPIMSMAFRRPCTTSSEQNKRGSYLHGSHNVEDIL